MAEDTAAEEAPELTPEEQAKLDAFIRRNAAALARVRRQRWRLALNTARANHWRQEREAWWAQHEATESERRHAEAERIETEQRQRQNAAWRRQQMRPVHHHHEGDR